MWIFIFNFVVPGVRIELTIAHYHCAVLPLKLTGHFLCNMFYLLVIIAYLFLHFNFFVFCGIMVWKTFYTLRRREML